MFILLVRITSKSPTVVIVIVVVEVAVEAIVIVEIVVIVVLVIVLVLEVLQYVSCEWDHHIDFSLNIQFYCPIIHLFPFYHSIFWTLIVVVRTATLGLLLVILTSSINILVIYLLVLLAIYFQIDIYLRFIYKLILFPNWI